MAFCTAADVESYMQFEIDSDLETHLTNNIIPLADAVVKEYVGYDVEQAIQVETFTGDKTKELFLSHLPINSITSVVEDDFTLTQGNDEDYIFYSNGRLQRVGHRWSYAKPQNIVVTYNAGYYARGSGNSPELPIQFKSVSERASARLLQSSLIIASQQEAGDVTGQSTTEVSNFTLGDSQRIGDYSITYPGSLNLNSTAVLTATDMSLLSPFRRQFFV